MTWKLNRVRQCKKCPWKVSTDPHDIPDGYCETRHKALADTIADPEAGNLNVMLNGATMRVMACHKSIKGRETYCVGWLHNQTGSGNNIALRFLMLSCENFDAIKLDGPQHATFADTLPKTSIDDGTGG